MREGNSWIKFRLRRVSPHQQIFVRPERVARSGKSGLTAKYNGASEYRTTADSSRRRGPASHARSDCRNPGRRRIQVLEASNADEAIRILEARDNVRIVFTDIDMPGSMDGLKLARAVRDRWPPIKIVITSGQLIPNEVDLQRAITQAVISTAARPAGRKYFFRHGLILDWHAVPTDLVVALDAPSHRWERFTQRFDRNSKTAVVKPAASRRGPSW